MPFVQVEMHGQYGFEQFAVSLSEFSLSRQWIEENSWQRSFELRGSLV